ncbi:TPA: hypothetical protein R2318_000188 [Legionella pneumophila]|nr:hypothetical protein [Legionella pneumophila]HAT8333764.1 hypothetical protein [Legionella pneumophila]HAU2316456.1 hypothetical protein [Legionella pneumophila]HCJ1049172.1 hypothetical protein [Legionella pneumophila]HEC4725069.1 hypothetical protein [Legionella pneumophila]
MLIKKSNYDCLPIEVPNQYIQESITIFDKRMELFSGHIAGIYSKTGLSTDKLIYFDEEEIVIPAVFRISESHPLELPITFSNEERINISPMYFIYFQEYKIIQDYLRTINSNHVFDLYMISIIAIFLYLSLDFIFTKNLPLVGFYQVGYFLFNKSSFEKFAEDHFDEAKKTVEKIFLQEVNFDVQTVFREMIKKSPSSYPFYSPGYFYIGREDQICVDLDTCSSMLTKYLEHKVIEGELANKRATQFENSLQKLIDSTIFKPDKNVRDIVDKKSINFKSEQITDIDAAFLYKGTLILVSAKSYIYNMDYDKGNYNYIRNIKSNIEADICKWRNKIDFINNNPIGDNYDLSSYGKIQGILCTPSLFYIGADYYKSKIECGIDEYQSATELYDLITNS